jgi:hypothetical protein
MGDVREWGLVGPGILNHIGVATVGKESKVVGIGVAR